MINNKITFLQYIINSYAFDRVEFTGFIKMTVQLL